MSSLLRRPEHEPPAAGATHAGANVRLRVCELDDGDRHALRRLLEADPVTNAVLAARLEHVASVSARRLGGTVFGVRDTAGELRAAAFHGGNLLPVGGDAEAWTLLARRLAVEARACSSIVGPRETVGTFWRELEPSWGQYRAIRDSQPLLVTIGVPPERPRDPRVQRVRPEQTEAYVPAAAAMFTEELGISPYACVQPRDYRRRIAGLVAEGRAFAVLDDDGEVAFKADLGAVSGHTCQIQGVWVRPDLRGRGLGTAAMATVLDEALRLAPSASLYVNDFNGAARRMYDRLGMTQIGTLRTILF